MFILYVFFHSAFMSSPTKTDGRIPIKWGGRHTRLLPQAKILLTPIKFFFLCWVDYALEGSTL